MSCTKITSSYKSRDEIHSVSYHVWFPEGEVRGVIQISHGMCEYVMRYDDFAEYLASHGFVVCGNDHLGHGGSVNSEEELGYFGEKNGWENVVADLHTLTKIMKKNYPDVPYFIFGHSMGSFMARAYCIRYGYELDAAVFCGTSGGMKGLEGMLTLIDGLKKLQGERYRSSLVDNIAFGTYNRKIPHNKTSYDWISRDTDIVDKYSRDDRCTFIFTLNGFENLMKVLWYVSSSRWYSSFRKNLPVLLISGDADPVGAYGKGVQRVYDKMLENGCDVKLKLYSGARHELVNETNRSEVYKDVLDFFRQFLP